MCIRDRSYIVQLMKSLVGSRFRRGNQYVLGDYIENLIRFNVDRSQELSKYKLIPFMIELNGKPGIGKSTFVDFLCELINKLFPFYDEQDAIYNRVNDKFWNGYKQQPVVLYDDQNQNRELRYNLDNEIIQLGSGQFVHPPMAFEKNTKFSSLFVVFTTNKRILETTKVNKGAISRRVKTYFCEPKSDLGTYVSNEIEGEKWVYDDDVFLNPFNLEFNGEEFVHVIFDFMSFMTKQRSMRFDKTSIFYYFGSRLRKQPKTLEVRLDEFSKSKLPDIQKLVTKQLKQRVRQINKVTNLLVDNVEVTQRFPIKEYSLHSLGCDFVATAYNSIRTGIFMKRGNAIGDHLFGEHFGIEISLQNNVKLLIEKDELKMTIAKVIGDEVVGLYNFVNDHTAYVMNLDTATLYDSWTWQNMKTLMQCLSKFYGMRVESLKSKENNIYSCSSPTEVLNTLRMSFGEAVRIFDSMGTVLTRYG